MKRIASLAVMFGTLLFSIPAIAGETCPDTSRAASMLAQDYRLAVGKVRIACDRSSVDCTQNRIHADQILNQLIDAHQAMLVACVFTGPVLDDSLPVTAATIVAAIDLVPESLLLPCNVIGGPANLELGCPNGSLLNITKSNLVVLPAALPSFSYSLTVNLNGSIPISSTFGSCNLTLSTPTGIPVSGTATFSSSSSTGTPLNRLRLISSPISLQSLQFSGCGALSGILEQVLTFVSGSLETTITAILSPQFCGATGPELFGPCP
jgi:hypothetical protein